MSLFARRGLGDSSSELVPARGGSRAGSVSVDAQSALFQSVVWSCLVLRADMVSTLPVDVFRKVNGQSVEVQKPPVLVMTGGAKVTLREWLWASQFDLDRVGNAYGIITKVDGAGKPAEIQLVDHRTVTVRVTNGVVSYRVGQKLYAESEIWHERQFTVPGLVMGLSPVAYAAWSIGMYQSAEQFALEWFGNGGQIPSGHLQNTKTSLKPEQAAEMRARYKEGVAARDIFVSGNDWEFKTVDSASKDAEFISTQQQAELAIARYFGVPGDLIDVQGNASSVTYANITERNLQFLIYHLQPTLTRREEALSSLLAQPRFVKFNTAALLRMDPAKVSTTLIAEVAGKITAPSEARALMNRAPFTEEQWAEFDRIAPKPVPAFSSKGASS